MSRIKLKEIERWIVKYANSTRRKSGLQQFRTNLGLTRIARSHSSRMAANKRIWHGQGVYQASSSLSYKSFLDFIKTFFYKGYSGENVGLMCLGRVRGFKKSIRSNKDIALAQHHLWMKSPGHRANILNPNFRLIGIGVKRNRNGFYCTQLFYG